MIRTNSKIMLACGVIVLSFIFAMTPAACTGEEDVVNLASHGGAMDVKQKCMDIANEKFTELGYNLEEYDVDFREDTFYTVIYTPKTLQFGGGAQIALNKQDFSIREVVYHQ